MPLRESQIDALARFMVQGLISRGSIRPKADERELIACVVELMSANAEQEAAIDDEADKMAEELSRKDSRLDPDKLRGMIRQRIAEKKGFTL